MARMRGPSARFRARALCLQATGIDVTSQTACGHGRVTCWTAYCGPDVNFKRDDLQVVPGEVPECVLYVDTFLQGDEDVDAALAIWGELRPFLERDDIPKVLARRVGVCMNACVHDRGAHEPLNARDTPGAGNRAPACNASPLQRCGVQHAVG